MTSSSALQVGKVTSSRRTMSPVSVNMLQMSKFTINDYHPFISATYKNKHVCTTVIPGYTHSGDTQVIFTETFMLSCSLPGSLHNSVGNTYSYSTPKHFSRPVSQQA